MVGGKDKGEVRIGDGKPYGIGGAPVQAGDESLYDTGLIRLTRVDGRYGTAVRLPDLTGIGPWLSADGRTLLFTRRDRSTRNYDLFVARRRADGSWGPAEPLPAPLNSPMREGSPSLSPDGRILFFTRGFDIYWVRLPRGDQAGGTR